MGTQVGVTVLSWRAPQLTQQWNNLSIITAWNPHSSMQCPCGRACAAVGCPTPPAARSDFCHGHSHLARKCRVFIVQEHLPHRRAGDLKHPTEWNRVPRDPHAAGGGGGQWCGNDAAPGSMVCDDAYCRRVLHWWGSPTHVAFGRRANESRRMVTTRQLAWHAVRAMHRFERTFVLGFYLVICACGATSCLLPDNEPQHAYC